MPRQAATSASSSAPRDTAPADRRASTGSASHKKGAGKEARIRTAIVSYHGFGGMLVATRNPHKGLIIAGRAEAFGDLWIDAGRANPSIMRVLEMMTIGGPYVALVLAYGDLALELLKDSGLSPMDLFKPAVPPTEAPGYEQGAQSFGLGGYEPAGPSAPTDTPDRPEPMAPYDPEQLRIEPDEGLTADEDRMLREFARQSKRPYDELRTQLLMEKAQAAITRNGHVVTPGALGAPIARE